MIVTTKELFAHAYGKYAIGAYNINNLEQTMGLFKGNVDSQAPFIVQLSKGARSYTHKLMLEAMMKTANEIFPEAVFAIHLDHGDEATCMDCINSGYSSVMIDHSHASFEENVAVTKRVVEAAHAKGVVVEAEIGQLKGVEEDVVAAEHVYTKPEESEAIPALRTYFKAYVTSDQVRHIIESKQFTDLATNPVFSTRDFKAVPKKYRTLIPDYIKDYVSLNLFIA